MSAGKRRGIITLESASPAVNEAGTAVMSWKSFATLRAEVIRQSAAEFVAGFGTTEESAVVFRTIYPRYPRQLSTADTVIFEGMRYRIREIVETDRRPQIEIRCSSIGEVRQCEE